MPINLNCTPLLIQPMELHLDDLIGVLEVRKFGTELPLNSEQLALLNHAYGQIAWYTGQITSVRAIEGQLGVLGDLSPIRLKETDYFRCQDLQLLTLRTLRPSSSGPSRSERRPSNKSETLRLSLKQPGRGNQLIYLAAGAENRLYLGLGSLVTAGPRLDFEGKKIAEIVYQLEVLKLSG